MVSGTMEVRVAVVWPFAPVGAGVETVLPEPLTLRDTVWPDSAWPWSSMAVMVTVEAVLPSAATVVGLATAEEALVLTGPATKLTVREAELVAVPMVAMAVPPNLAVTVAFVSVVDEVSVAW